MELCRIFTPLPGIVPSIHWSFGLNPTPYDAVIKLRKSIPRPRRRESRPTELQEKKRSLRVSRHRLAPLHDRRAVQNCQLSFEFFGDQFRYSASVGQLVGRDREIKMIVYLNINPVANISVVTMARPLPGPGQTFRPSSAPSFDVDRLLHLSDRKPPVFFSPD